MDYRIKVAPPELEEEMVADFCLGLRGEILQGEASVAAFEASCSSVLHHLPVLALNSGTSALHLALLLLEVKPGDDVICPTFSFAATANTIVYTGARPVFIDSEEDSWNICPVLMEKAIEAGLAKNKKPKVIIVVHAYGVPANLDRICALGKKYLIPIVEDAAGAFGSMYRGRQVGCFGTLGVFSFNYNKIVTTTGGGLLVGQDASLIARARYLSAQAKAPTPYYEHHDIGYNYRMSGMAAALGSSQLPLLGARLARKSRIYLNYVNTLKKITGIKFVLEDERRQSNNWIVNIVFEEYMSRNRVMKSFANNGIEFRYLWNPLHLQPVFSSYEKWVNGFSQKLFRSGLSLPSGSRLAQSQQNEIINLILKAI